MDKAIIFIPFCSILILCVLFVVKPEKSAFALDSIRGFLGDRLGFFYVLTGAGCLAISLYMAFSKYGGVKLGNIDKPEYSSFKWGTMIFTSTMAADILFYSCCEWALYATEEHIQKLGGVQQWASTYPLFHWGPIAWSFYIVLAVAFGFMLHVKNRSKQKFSEACRPLLGRKTDGWLGRAIDLLAVLALLAGTATTFTLATPLLSAALAEVFHIDTGTKLTLLILIGIAVVYTLTVIIGMKGISYLAGICMYLFFVLLAYVLFAGGETIYIVETGIQAVGNLAQNFIGMSSYMDPLRENHFAQNWTIFYWAYWMAWCVATPFFIGKISKGRTIKNVVIGGYGWGLAGTFTSFIILGNYGLAQQMKHGIHISGRMMESGNYSEAIIKIFGTLPLHKLALLMLVVTMIAFYVTTFDSLTMVVSAYSYKELPAGKEPAREVRAFWAVLFIMFPIALIYADNSIGSLQSVSIIAAFPIGLIIVAIIVSFFKDAGEYLEK
ncbi:MAG: BCCT family transporter [Lachnospiraceae bacterium]|nr:BCCT family transporter [Lachnospiraceae bacterium]